MESKCSRDRVETKGAQIGSQLGENSLAKSFRGPAVNTTNCSAELIPSLRWDKEPLLHFVSIWHCWHIKHGRESPSWGSRGLLSSRALNKGGAVNCNLLPFIASVRYTVDKRTLVMNRQLRITSLPSDLLASYLNLLCPSKAYQRSWLVTISKNTYLRRCCGDITNAADTEYLADTIICPLP